MHHFISQEKNKMTTRPQLNTQLDAVVFFISKMDADMVSTLLDGAYTYQDYSKSSFIKKLDELFFKFSQSGDFHLLMERGECYGCSCGSKGYSFIGNKSKSYIDFIFITNDENQVIDIYECDEFNNKSTKHRKKKRLFLDACTEFDLEEDGFFDDDPNFGGELPPF